MKYHLPEFLGAGVGPGKAKMDDGPEVRTSDFGIRSIFRDTNLGCP